MKKAWEKPVLIVMARRNAEESVLAACKCDTAPVDPDGTNDNCDHETHFCNPECFSIAAS